MEFQLAFDLHMTHDELLERMSTREFVEWMGWYQARKFHQEMAEKKARQQP